MASNAESGDGAKPKTPKKRTATKKKTTATRKRKPTAKKKVNLAAELEKESAAVATPEPVLVAIEDEPTKHVEIERVEVASKPIVLDKAVGREATEPIPPAAGGFLRGGVRSADVTNFLRQLIMLLQAGTPILKSLRTLSKRGSRPAVCALIADIAEYVEQGNPLWQAFDRHPRYFDTVFVNLIKAAEASGTLVVVLERVTEYREQRELLGRRVRGAMVYPVILIAACFGVLILLATFVVPEFEEMFKKANLEIPQETVIFLNVSNTVAVFWWVPIVVVVLLVLFYQMWFVRNPVRRHFADRMKLRLPVVGPILHKNAIVEMCHTMSLLLRSGLSMMATLDLTRSAIHNRAVAESLQSVRNSVEQGGGLEAPMRAHSDVIPPVVADMFVTGEESGRVDVVTEQIARRYEEEVKISVSTLGEALQPIFTVIIGIVVIILFISLFMPILGMIEQITNAGA